MTEERRNLYRLLHVQPEAPREVIKASYRTLMSTLRTHPDLGGDAEAAARLNAAYAVLMDPDLRRAYDRTLGRERAAGQPAEPPLVGPGDPATWFVDGRCPFCGLELPASIHPTTRCVRCHSPLFRLPAGERGELFGRRRNPRNARPMSATLRVPGTAGDFNARVRDLSLTGLGLLAPIALPSRSAMRVVTGAFDTVAVVVGCRSERNGFSVHGELLTLQLLRSSGVFVSARA